MESANSYQTAIDSSKPTLSRQRIGFVGDLRCRTIFVKRMDSTLSHLLTKKELKEIMDEHPRLMNAFDKGTFN